MKLLTSLLRKNALYLWSDKFQESFEDIKRRLNETTVLVLPSRSGVFVVCIESSGLGLGGMLIHEAKVIAYASR